MKLSILFGAFALGLTMSFQAQSQDGYFRDDFTGTSLKPELSFLTEDKDRWTLVDNEYLMIVPRKNDASTTNHVVYNNVLHGDSNFSISAKNIPSHVYFVIYVDIFNDDENYLELSYYHQWDKGQIHDSGNYNKYISFTKNLKGEKSSYLYKNGVLGEVENLQLSIQKKGVEYVGYFSVDGGNWIDLGTHVLIDFKGNPGLGVYNSDNAPEAPVRIDYFEIRPID